MRILPAEGHGLQGSFGTIVVRLKAAMLEIGPDIVGIRIQGRALRGDGADHRGD